MLTKDYPRTMEGKLQYSSTDSRQDTRFPRKAVSGRPSPFHQSQITTDAQGEDRLICSLDQLHNANIANTFREELQELAT